MLHSGLRIESDKGYSYFTVLGLYVILTRPLPRIHRLAAKCLWKIQRQTFESG